ncbi:hypothetical protein ABT247_12510 [Kitasatospora sp. NPDC001539]|uniref:hypothetical protein n=1 Tax=Kitasatospora sp. NPDC001539 TaxID=3154384 RepID=UPI003317FDF7
MAEMFPDTGRLQLANGATSGPVPFTVDPAAATWVLLIVAIGPDCAPLGGRAPDIELRADAGLITAVPQAPATADILDRIGGSPVATASWTRDADDVFTVQLAVSDPADRDWSVRITNTDPQELGFVWSSEGTVKRARQARPELDTSVQTTVLTGRTPADILVPIADIGPGPMEFTATAGQPMGAGFVLKSFPAGLAPNACGKLRIGVTPATGTFPGPPENATFNLTYRDPVERSVTLNLSRTEQKGGKDGKDGKDSKEPSKDHKDDKDGTLEKLPEFSPSGGLAPRPPEHFIPPAQRPDLTDSALRDEPPEPEQAEG